MNRAQRRAAARKHPVVRAVIGAESQRARLELELLDQAREIRRTSPTPNETPEQALSAVEASIADLSAPQYEFVAGKALAELRALRDDLRARIGAH